VTPAANRLAPETVADSVAFLLGLPAILKVGNFEIFRIRESAKV
jgi:hypothetical protein